MKMSDLLKICEASHSMKVLCVGDIMLDRFSYGKVERISPEAPIPVLKQTKELSMLGAAGNVARNVASMGSVAVLIGVIGEDEAGSLLKMQLEDEPQITDQLSSEADRVTTVKIRYIANGQQLLRVDNEDSHDVSGDAENEICANILKTASACKAILLSDYAKGCVTPAVINACLTAAKCHSIPIIVDPKGTDFSKYGAVDVLKPNAKELSDATGLPTNSDDEIERALNALLQTSDAKCVLVTRSEKGLSFIQRGHKVRHVQTVKREVFDVSGAGDTSLTALGIALGSKADITIASEFALSAAGIAVGKVGTATVTMDEIRNDIRSRNSTRSDTSDYDEESIFNRVADWKRQGLKVGFTNGCFDILHAGHLSVLQFAANHCDRLIVGLNSDASVKRLKGEQRPINGEIDRQILLTGLKPVDAVIIFDDDTPQSLIERLQPDLIVKGGDYTPETVVGADTVLANGGQVLIAPILEGRSTTSIIAKSQS